MPGEEDADRVRRRLDGIPDVVANLGMDAALAQLAELAQVARGRGGPGLLYAVLVQQGRWTAKTNLDAGIALSLEAQQILDTAPGLPHDARTRSDRVYGQGQLAILLADDGRLSSAHRMVEEAEQHLQPGDPYTHVLANFRAQILAGLGRVLDADKLLADAAYLPFEQKPGWHAYNQMLHHHLHARELGVRVDSNYTIMDLDRIWRRAHSTGEVNLTLIVRNLYAETMICLAPRSDDPLGMYAEAAGHARRNLDKANQIGEIRSEIVTRSLLARASHALDLEDDAVEEATRAVALLDSAGGKLPALRGDEVLHHSAVILAAHDQPERAQDLDRRARAEFDRRLGLLDPADRDKFCQLTSNQAVIRGIGFTDQE